MEIVAEPEGAGRWRVAFHDNVMTARPRARHALDHLDVHALVCPSQGRLENSRDHAGVVRVKTQAH